MIFQCFRACSFLRVVPLLIGVRFLAFGQVTVKNPSFDKTSVGVCPQFKWFPESEIGWKITSGGITTAGCGAAYNAPVPQSGFGGQVAFIQAGGKNPTTILSQEVSGFVPGHSYVVRFYGAGRPAKDCFPCGPLSFSVNAGTAQILAVENPPQWQFQQYTTQPFTASASTILISFSGVASPGDDKTAFIDSVSILDLASSKETGTTVSSENVTAAPEARAAGGAGRSLVANDSFEVPFVGGCPNFKYNPPGSGWSLSGGGITSAGCGQNFNAPGPIVGAGVQVAFIQSNGQPATISQTVTGLIPGHSYVVKFFAAGRPLCETCQALDFSVFAGTTDILAVRDLSFWQFLDFTTRPFLATSASEVISFTGAAHGKDETSFVDMVSVVDLQSTGGQSLSISMAPLTGEMVECEATGGCGLFRLTGRLGSASWPNGSEAQIVVEQFDARQIVIRRTDPPVSSSPGLAARYVGKIDGGKVTGTVTWSWHGNPRPRWHGNPVPDTWSGYININDPKDGDHAMIPSIHKRNESVALPAIDLNGIWEGADPKYVYHFIFKIEQSGNAIKMTDLTRYRVIEDGRENFRGVYSGQSIQGTFLDEKGWIPGQITLITPDTFNTSFRSLFRRTSAPGNELPCDESNPFGIDADMAFKRGKVAYNAPDYTKAACWMRIGALQGNALAQAVLGLMYLEGKGVKRDDAAAFLWIKRSALQGFQISEQFIAEAYAAGKGVPKDPDKSEFWKRKVEFQQAMEDKEAGEAAKRQHAADLFLGLFGGAPLTPSAYEPEECIELRNTVLDGKIQELRRRISEKGLKCPSDDAIL